MASLVIFRQLNLPKSCCTTIINKTTCQFLARMKVHSGTTKGIISARQQQQQDEAFPQAAPLSRHHQQEPLHILGAGAIGLLWAASIRSAVPSFPVVVLLRDKHKHRMTNNNNNNNTISVRLVQHEQPRTVQVPAQVLCSQPPPETNLQQQPIRNLLIATKAFQAVPALQSVVHRLENNADSKIIILCNGAQAVRALIEAALQNAGKGSCRVHFASTTHGAFREQSSSSSSSSLPPSSEKNKNDEDFHVVHAGHGKTFLEGCPDMSELWNQSGLNCQSLSETEMHEQVWCKLAANCVINPLTAVHECCNGDLLRLPNFEATCQSIVREVADVARLSLSSLLTPSQEGQVFKDFSAGAASAGADIDATSKLTATSLQSFVMQAIEDTANNRSSMWQDIMASRPTEIDYLNGHIVQQGFQFGVPCPVNRELWKEVRALTTNFEAAASAEKMQTITGE